MEDHNTDVIAYSSENCAVVTGARGVVLQKNGVMIRRDLCESRCWRRGIENGLECPCVECQSSEDEMEGETSHDRCYESRRIGLGR